MPKTILAPITALALAASLCLAADPPRPEPPELPDDPVVQHLQRVAVTVKTARGTGSGFVLKRGGLTFVLTAAHVVEGNRVEERDAPESKPRVKFNDCQLVQNRIKDGRIVGSVSLDAEVVRYSDIRSGDDLALLLLRDPDAFDCGAEFYRGKKLPPLGTRVWHVGSLLGEFGSNSTVGGTVAQHGRLIDGKVLDQCDLNSFRGSSGGLVTLADGRVIGMVVRGAEGGFSLMVPARRMEEWAKRSGCEWLFSPERKRALTAEEVKKHPVEDCPQCEKNSKP